MKKKVMLAVAMVTASHTMQAENLLWKNIKESFNTTSFWDILGGFSKGYSTAPGSFGRGLETTLPSSKKKMSTGRFDTKPVATLDDFTTYFANQTCAKACNGKTPAQCISCKNTQRELARVVLTDPLLHDDCMAACTEKLNKTDAQCATVCVPTKE